MMINTERIDEIVSGIPAFGRDVYSKEEFLPELLNLQKQLVETLFDKAHADLAKLRLWDVEEHLSQMNADRGNIADAELEKVLSQLSVIGSLIRTEISGSIGERKALWTLEKVRGLKRILQNVELSAEEHRTELDAILLTSKALFIIEVKNLRKDVVIDEKGNFCRVSDKQEIDKNIGEQMTDKEHLLRIALQDTEYAKLNIQSIVVFANSEIEVTNSFPYINTCFLSELPHLIANFKGENLYNTEELERMSSMILAAESRDTYPVPFNAEEFKRNFAVLVAKLEDSETYDVMVKKSDEEGNLVENAILNECDNNAEETLPCNSIANFICVVICVMTAFIARKLQELK